MYAIRPETESEPDIWHALADPTRRLLIDRLAGGARTTSQLCENMPMSRFGVMKHLGILERAGLVIARRQGRLRLNHLNAAPLRALHTRWASARADALADAAINLATDIGATDMPEGHPSAQAQIVDIALEWPVEASVQRVWQALFDRVETWCPAAHRAVGADAAMTFEARLGGQLREARARRRRHRLVRGHRARSAALGRPRRAIWRRATAAPPRRCSTSRSCPARATAPRSSSSPIPSSAGSARTCAPR